MFELGNYKDLEEQSRMEISELVKNYDFAETRRLCKESAYEAHKEVRELRKYTRYGK